VGDPGVVVGFNAIGEERSILLVSQSGDAVAVPDELDPVDGS
jgi:hypothetical protein